MPSIPFTAVQMQKSDLMSGGLHKVRAHNDTTPLKVRNIHQPGEGLPRLLYIVDECHLHTRSHC